VATNLTQIYNLALSAVGTRQLTSYPSERSREAEICDLHWAVVLPQVMRAAPWASARASARLALIAQTDSTRPWARGDPEPGWLYTYALPTDFIYPRYLSDWSRFILGQETQSPEGIKIQVTTLMTNTPEAVLVYTRNQETIPLWDADLVSALSNALAAAIAMPLHGKTARTSLALQLANEAILRARVHTANEDTNQYDSVPDWLAARGVTSGDVYNKYVFPVGPLLTGSLMTGGN
jgi:hypothetical protein